MITVLKYAGDGKWSYEEDAYNPMNFLVMVQDYARDATSSALCPTTAVPSPRT